MDCCWTQNINAVSWSRSRNTSSSLISRGLLQIQRNLSESHTAFTRQRPEAPWHGVVSPPLGDAKVEELL